MNLRPCATLTEEEARRERAAHEAARQLGRQLAGCAAVALVLFATWGHWAKLLTVEPEPGNSRPWAGNSLFPEFWASTSTHPADNPRKFVSWRVLDPSGSSPLADAPEKRSPHLSNR